MKKKSPLPTTPSIPTVEKSRLIAALLDEKQAENIAVLDVSSVCPIAEHIIVATGRGQRHAQSLADLVISMAKEKGFVSFGKEGYEAGTWILVDLNDVILHIFQDEARRFYNIEGLWAEGKRLDAPKGVTRDAEDEMAEGGQ